MLEFVVEVNNQISFFRRFQESVFQAIMGWTAWKSLLIF